MKSNFKSVLALCAVMVCTMFCGCGAKPESGADATDAASSEQPAVVASEPAAQTAAPSSRPDEPKETKFYIVDRDAKKEVNLSSKMCETDDSFYYLTSEDMILFSDKSYPDWQPLCGKPNCRHTARETDCNAKLEGDAGSITVYGNHLYYAFVDPSDNMMRAAVQIWRMKLDGSDHELIAVPEYTFEGAEPNHISQSLSCRFHNKYLFVDLIRATGADAPINTKQKEFVFDLSRPEDGLSELSFKLDGGEETVGHMSMRYAEGDIIYSTDTLQGNTVYKLDLSTRTAKTLCTLPFEYAFIRWCSLYEGKLWFCSWYDEGMIVSVDAETGETEIVNTAEPGKTLWWYHLGEYIIGASPDYGDGCENGTVIYDKNGNEVQRITCDEMGVGLTFCCVFGNYAFGQVSTNDPTQTDIIDFLSAHAPVWYLDLNDIGTNNLMWRKWEP